MYAIGLSIAKLTFTSEETRPKVYLLFDIRYDTIHIKQYHTVTCFVCVLTEAC